MSAIDSDTYGLIGFDSWKQDQVMALAMTWNGMSTYRVLSISYAAVLPFALARVPPSEHRGSHLFELEGQGLTHLSGRGVKVVPGPDYTLLGEFDLEEAARKLYVRSLPASPVEILYKGPLRVVGRAEDSDVILSPPVEDLAGQFAGDDDYYLRRRAARRAQSRSRMVADGDHGHDPRVAAGTPFQAAMFEPHYASLCTYFGIDSPRRVRSVTLPNGQVINLKPNETALYSVDAATGGKWWSIWVEQAPAVWVVKVRFGSQEDPVGRVKDVERCGSRPEADAAAYARTLKKRKRGYEELHARDVWTEE